MALTLAIDAFAKAHAGQFEDRHWLCYLCPSSCGELSIDIIFPDHFGPFL
jgi:hypothetical protein